MLGRSLARYGMEIIRRIALAGSTGVSYQLDVKAANDFAHHHAKSSMHKLLSCCTLVTKASFHQNAVVPKTERYENFIQKLSSLGKGEIRLEKDSSGIAVMMVDNPERKNALTGHMMAQLSRRVEELENWKDGKAVILKGMDKTFCSGGDLNAVMKDIGAPEEGRMMCLFMQSTLNRLKDLPLISVAAIEGRALGGGAEVILSLEFQLVFTTWL